MRNTGRRNEKKNDNNNNKIYIQKKVRRRVKRERESRVEVKLDPLSYRRRRVQHGRQEEAEEDTHSPSSS
jgi:hypothetical protein